MAEFRAIPAGDRGELRRIRRYAFAPEYGPPTEEPSGEWPPSLFDEYGRYVDGDLVSACMLYTLEARLRGEYVALGGLGAVATAPERRGEGHARALCRDALEEYRRRDVGLVALWPMATPFYRRLGWATANRYVDCTLPPETLPSHDAEGRLHPLDAGDWRRLRRVETAFGERTALSLRRSEAWWRERTLADWEGGGSPYCYGYERDGDLRGYAVYTVGDDDARTLTVEDLAHADEEAHRALLDFLGGHGAQIERIRLRRSAESDLLDRVRDPDAVECRVKPGPMVRLTGVDALAELAWPAVDATWTMAVTDPLVDRNDGRFRVTLDDGRATVESIDSTDATIDATLGVGTLSQLVVGRHGIDAAERVGSLELAERADRRRLESCFRPGSVCLRAYF